jgi:hypothetical protein
VNGGPLQRVLSAGGPCCTHRVHAGRSGLLTANSVWVGATMVVRLDRTSPRTFGAGGQAQKRERPPEHRRHGRASGARPSQYGSLVHERRLRQRTWGRWWPCNTELARCAGARALARWMISRFAQPLERPQSPSSLLWQLRWVVRNSCRFRSVDGNRAIVPGQLLLSKKSAARTRRRTRSGGGEAAG